MLDDIFTAIKQQVSMKETAKFYGLQMNRSGMACCPFHEDRTPSLKVNDDYFYCFGCGATGDQIAFTARMFNLSQYETAKKMNHDFGFGLTEQGNITHYNSILDDKRKFSEWEYQASGAVCEYLRLLNQWRSDYTPANPDEPHHPLFVESLQRTGYIEYLCDIFTFGTDSEKRELYEQNQRDISNIQRRLKEVTSAEVKKYRKVI